MILMKNNIILLLALSLCFAHAKAQKLTVRSQEFALNLSEPGSRRTDVPLLTWTSPLPDVNYTQAERVRVEFEVLCERPIESVTLLLRDSSNTYTRGQTTVVPSKDSHTKVKIEKSLVLAEGQNVLQVVAQNIDGQKTFSERKFHVGGVGLADASKLDREDYALIFASDEYDNWTDLVNPIFDAKTIADELKRVYGFKVELVQNASQSEVLKKMREYAERKYKPLDQVFIFFAGHGTFDQTFGEGFVVTRESQVNDEAKTSYLSHNRLRSIVNNIPCEHIFLTMDVCFGGTFDASVATSRGIEEETYKEENQGEYITRKLAYKTRRFMTSGGKTYVSDGIRGKHSPFAKNFIEALRSHGGKDGILTLPELHAHVERLKIQPVFGEFGDNAPGSDFLFIVK